MRAGEATLEPPHPLWFMAFPTASLSADLLETLGRTGATPTDHEPLRAPHLACDADAAISEPDCLIQAYCVPFSTKPKAW